MRVCACVCVFKLGQGTGIFLSESRSVFLGGGTGMDGWTEAAGVEECGAAAGGTTLS